MESSLMKLKIAVILIGSVTMSAQTSYGNDLLDRMLGRAGCSSCVTPAVSSCGCTGGGLIDRLLNRSSSSCAGEVLNVDSGAACGKAHSGCKAGSLLARMSDGVGGVDCGCDGGVVVEAASSCGCDGGLIESTPVASSCGCDSAPIESAPVASSCGCDSAPIESAPVAVESSCGCGVQSTSLPAAWSSRLRSLGGNVGSRLRSAAPVASAQGCGCGSDHVVAQPAVSSCGCQSDGGVVAAAAFDRPRLSLLDRLRGNRIPRDRDGRVIGVSNDGCNPPCPNRPAAGCGCGHSAEPAPCSSCSACGGGEVIYSDGTSSTPTSGGCANGLCGSETPVYGGGGSGSRNVAVPAAGAGAAAAGSDSGTIEPVPDVSSETGGSSTRSAIQGATEEIRDAIDVPGVTEGSNRPLVDPGAFIPHGQSTLGNEIRSASR